MINLARWIVALPAGIIAAIAVHFLATLFLSLGHGFDTVASFWNASDMNGMPVSGTYIVLVTRGLTAAALVGVPAYIVPMFHKHVGVILASIVIVGFVAMLVYLGATVGTKLGLGIWYKNILEVVAYGIGAVVGAAIGNAEDQKARVNA